MADRPMHTVPGLFDKLQQLYAEGERAVEEGRFEDAIALFTEGIGLDDHFRQRYVTMYAQRAFARQRLGDAEGAIPDYTQAIEMEPEINQAQYYFHRGLCHAQANRPAEAVEDYGRSIALHGEEPGPFHLRGKILTSNLGRHAEAIADFDRFLQTWSHPEVWQLRGWAKLNLGRGAEAIPDLEKSQELQPDPYTQYLQAWAGAVAPDDELFYRSMQAVLAAAPEYRQYFVDNDDFRRFYGEARFKQIVGE
jgi:tetratricopeptide (TPR) repeat protein